MKLTAVSIAKPLNTFSNMPIKLWQSYFNKVKVIVVEMWNNLANICLGDYQGRKRPWQRIKSITYNLKLKRNVEKNYSN